MKIVKACFGRIDRRFIRHFSVLCLITFSVVLPIIGYNVKHSWYRYLWKSRLTAQGNVDQARTRNDVRIHEARRYFKTYKPTVMQQKQPFDVGISIITISRNRHRLDNYEPFYLTQAVSTFLRILNNTKDLHLTYGLFLCNVDPYPSTYLEIKNMSSLKIPVFQRFQTDIQNTNFWRDNSLSKRLEKEKQDYVFCGQKMLDQNVSHVFLVEDDALPDNDLLPVTDSVLVRHVINQSNLHRPHRDVTYIKFYHPSEHLGFISYEVERIPELLGLSSILSLLLTILYTYIRPKMKTNFCSIWFILLIYFALVLLCIGRQALLELRRISTLLYQVVPAPSCCTPGMLYPRNGMIEVINYFSSITCEEGFGKDIALEKFKKNERKTALMVQPNLFTHVGMYSSLRNSIPKSFST